MAFSWKPPKLGAAGKTSTVQCKSCGGTEFDEFCESGDRACTLCGTVLQENGIVSTVQFSESGGTSNVVGQFVSGDRGRPSGSGAGARRGRFGQSRDSRDITIQNGKKMIMQVLAQLHLRNALAEPASRLFSLCVNQNYVQGRKTMNIVAACVYIVCRQQNYPIMLIDISDKLAVNVYILGKTFQKLIKYLNLQTAVPIVDPAMYIKRFAAKLDLGSKTNAVCMTALKIIGCMKRDFLATGRQPAGVCCAALTLATRVNRVERSKEEIRKAVRVCGSTVRKRLLEFEATPTSQLTVEELNKLPQDGAFPGMGDNAKGESGGGARIREGANPESTGEVSVRMREVRMDPPSFIANRIREGQLKMPWSEPIPPATRINSLKNTNRKVGMGKKPSVEASTVMLASPSCVKVNKGKGLPPGGEGVVSVSAVSTVNGDGTGGRDKEGGVSGTGRGLPNRGGVSLVGSESGGNEKGKGKRKEEEEEESDEEEDDDEGSSEDDDDSDEDYEDEGDNDIGDDGHLSLKMDMDANTDEGREALTRHVLSVRGKGQRKRSAKRLKVDREVYSCLTSMFDEDEKQARQIKDVGSMGAVLSTAGEAATAGEDTGGGVCNEGGGMNNDHDQGEGRSGGASGNEERGEVVAVPETITDAGGKGEEENESESWDMYLRTIEDQEKIKIEWESENKEWIESQEEKNRLQAEEEAKPGFSRKKRKYSTSGSMKTGSETFGQVLQFEAAKNKSLKIDHAALQRVMNLDGSFKQIGADDDSDEPMEEVEEGDPAPPVPLPLHRRGHDFRGGVGRAKSPLTATRTPSLLSSCSMEAPKVLPSKIELAGLTSFDGGKTPHQPQEEKKGVNETASTWGAAVSGPDDGGEKAIKDVLALLSTGGVDALTHKNDNNTGSFDTSHPAEVKTLETTKRHWEEIEEVEEAAVEVEGATMPAGDAGATGAAKKVDEEVEEEEEDDEEEEEEEEDDDDGGYRRMGGLYNRQEDYDDDDDPYGEEA